MWKNEGCSLVILQHLILIMPFPMIKTFTFFPCFTEMLNIVKNAFNAFGPVSYQWVSCIDTIALLWHFYFLKSWTKHFLHSILCGLLGVTGNRLQNPCLVEATGSFGIDFAQRADSYLLTWNPPCKLSILEKWKRWEFCPFSSHLRLSIFSAGDALSVKLC